MSLLAVGYLLAAIVGAILCPIWLACEIANWERCANVVTSIAIYAMVIAAVLILIGRFR
jgi:hypothetical protein